MELRQIQHAIAVVDHGGFTRAAAALHLAQPSLSQSIRALENDLGAALFLRLGRTVRLSEAGEAFLGPARQLLRDAEAVRSAVASLASMETGTLDVVALPTLVAEPLAAMVGAFRTRYPGASVRLAEPSSPTDLAGMIRDGRSEIGITDAGEVDDLVWISLGVQQLLAVLPPRTAVPRSGRMTLESLARRSLILTPLGTSTRAVLEAALANVGSAPTVGVETNQREAIIPLVLAGAGATVLPEPLAEEARRRGAVVCRLTPGLSRHIGLVHRSGPLSPSGRRFLELVADRAG